MKKISNNTSYISNPVVLCLGTFDGLHLGHKKLIETGNKIAKEKGYKTAVYSFDNIPANFFLHKKVNRKLFTHDEKISAFNNIGIDYLWLDEFNEKIAGVMPIDYLKYLKSVLNIKQIVVGFNYTFGSKAAGKTHDLVAFGKTMGFDVFVVEPVTIDDITVSSSKIRYCISYGDMENADRMLGNPFIISGKVVKGKQNGRKISFPTINILKEEGKLIPKFGVYATKTMIDGQEYKSITNVGIRPTVDNNNLVSVETNIFEFDEMCYNENAIVSFYKFMRDEVKFDSMDDLKIQIKKDVDDVKKYFETNGK